jgi:hypothetical protein
MHTTDPLVVRAQMARRMAEADAHRRTTPPRPTRHPRRRLADLRLLLRTRRPTRSRYAVDTSLTPGRNPS